MDWVSIYDYYFDKPQNWIKEIPEIYYEPDYNRNILLYMINRNLNKPNRNIEKGNFHMFIYTNSNNMYGLLHKSFILYTKKAKKSSVEIILNKISFICIKYVIINNIMYDMIEPIMDKYIKLCFK